MIISIDWQFFAWCFLFAKATGHGLVDFMSYMAQPQKLPIDSKKDASQAHALVFTVECVDRFR